MNNLEEGLIYQWTCYSCSHFLLWWPGIFTKSKIRFIWKHDCRRCLGLLSNVQLSLVSTVVHGTFSRWDLCPQVSFGCLRDLFSLRWKPLVWYLGLIRESGEWDSQVQQPLPFLPRRSHSTSESSPEVTGIPASKGHYGDPRFFCW